MLQDSRGNPHVRAEVAKFIEDRDGVGPSDPNVSLTQTIAPADSVVRASQGQLVPYARLTWAPLTTMTQSLSAAQVTSGTRQLPRSPGPMHSISTAAGVTIAGDRWQIAAVVLLWVCRAAHPLVISLCLLMLHASCWLCLPHR